MVRSKSQKAQQFDKKPDRPEPDLKSTLGESNLLEIGKPRHNLSSDHVLVPKNHTSLPRPDVDYTYDQTTLKVPTPDQISPAKVNPQLSGTSQFEVKQPEVSRFQVPDSATIGNMGTETVQKLLERAPEQPKVKVELELGDLQSFQDSLTKRMLDAVREEIFKAPQLQPLSSVEQAAIINRIQARIEPTNPNPPLQDIVQSRFQPKQAGEAANKPSQSYFNQELSALNQGSDFRMNDMVPVEEAAKQLGIEPRSVRRIAHKINAPTQHRPETIETVQEINRLYVHLPSLIDYRETFGKSGRPKQKDEFTNSVNRGLDK